MKNMEKWMENLPYPAVLMNRKEKDLQRNRRARCLLPPLARLKKQLFFQASSEDFISEMRLDGIAYLTVFLPVGDDVYLVCFFENFLPLQEVFSRSILESVQKFFWELLSAESDEENFGVIQRNRIADKLRALQMQGDDYLRLLNAPEILGSEKAEACSLDGFFGHLQKALEMRGICVSSQFCKGLTVYADGMLLSFLVLNLVHFIHLFEGKSQIDMNVAEEERNIRFSVEFPDGGVISSAFDRMILEGEESEKLLHVLPMLCIVRVCLDRGIPWSFQCRDGKVYFSFLLAKGDEKPVLFLSDATAAEVSELLQMVKRIFY